MLSKRDGHPDAAIDALLMDAPKNIYLGFNYGMNYESWVRMIDFSTAIGQ